MVTSNSRSKRANEFSRVSMRDSQSTMELDQGTRVYINDSEDIMKIDRDSESNNSIFVYDQAQSNKNIVVYDQTQSDHQIGAYESASTDDWMFTTEELEGIDVIGRGKNFIEVDCGCTTTRHGDAAGKLRIYTTGQIIIYCDCYPGCKKEISPSQFERHAGLTGLSNWRKHVWVFVNGDKVSLRETKLLKYYKGSASDPCCGVRPRRNRTVHRDELMKCTNCGKERRFYRRTKAECKIYHQAAANESWNCSDYPYQDLNCEDEEERSSKKKFRGCPVMPVCNGCLSCVCFGCLTCRFEDCSCRACVDFIRNAEPGN